MSNWYPNGNLVGNATTIMTTAGAQTYFQPFTIQYHPSQVGEPNAVRPDSPEQWLRRRVREVCELAT